MRLSPFIRENSQAIIAEWENFARSLVPAADGMTPLSLRNHISYILDFIANDIDTAQTDTEQTDKSRGKKPKTGMDSVAEIHAALRQAGGFNLDQMVSEYRALRASVTKLWGAQDFEPTRQSIVDLVRFNEAIDQATTESISYYSKKVEHSRDLFLAVLGHDLRNPIGAMMMSAELIAKIESLTERQKMFIAQVSLSGARAIGIIDQLVDVTRARLGSGMKVIREQMDMAFVCRQLVQEMRSLHPSRTFVIKSSGDTIGSWDRPRIGQVFSNLLGNAVQYGFTELPIDITVSGETDAVSLAIHNQGVPIPNDKIVGIFEAMVRGGAEGSGTTNLGLGLYITKEIVAAHGGSIKVSSSEKDGTTFTALFPRSIDAAAVGGDIVQSADNRPNR
ncbi:sensor histidine kinase [Bosea sp. PAMC 26642]|uniref:sensor histidine kinase n=1 Tax=Bosea sp. (strain PAMC 26642) TaxID=1792307 RepID=UPI00076FDFAC|nr:HAMP domain-containing sensor histidine kinase [Bosea sp. PAMC 26642]AMJ59386.1 histidine kinase [Bosea sp. PAMC 26642]